MNGPEIYCRCGGMSWKQFWSAPNSISQIAFMCRTEPNQREQQLRRSHTGLTIGIPWRRSLCTDKTNCVSVTEVDTEEGRGRGREKGESLKLKCSFCTSLVKPGRQERRQQHQNWNCCQYYLGNSASVVIKSDQHDHHGLSLLFLLWNSMENAFVQFTLR